MNVATTLLLSVTCWYLMATGTDMMRASNLVKAISVEVSFGIVGGVVTLCWPAARLYWFDRYRAFRERYKKGMRIYLIVIFVVLSNLTSGFHLSDMWKSSIWGRIMMLQSGQDLANALRASFNLFLICRLTWAAVVESCICHLHRGEK